MQKQFSLQFKVLTARFGHAKEKLIEDPNYKFRIYFTKRNGKSNTNGESYYTNKINLKDSLMIYKNEIIQLEKDSIEISFAIFNIKNKKYKPYVVKVKDLVIGEEDKEDLWAIPTQNLINVIYTLKENNDTMPISISTPVSIVQKPLAQLDNDKENNANRNKSSIISLNSIKEEGEKAKQPTMSINQPNGKMSEPFQQDNNNEVADDYASSSPKTQPKTSSLIKKTKSLFKNLISSKSKQTEEPNSTTPTAPNSLTISQNYELLEYQDTPLNTNINCNTIKETVSFCEGIFLSGLKSDHTALIDKSELFQAPCCHKECSLLPSYQPHILNIYQAKRKTPFDIADTVTDMCFPLGLKLCYKCKLSKGVMKDAPMPYHSFMNIILNEKGKRYIVTMIYFKKIKVKQFEQEYKLYPIKEFFRLNQDNVETSSCSISDKELQNAFNIMTEFVSQDTILIPEAITLISKFPYINQMSLCLKSLIGLSNEEMSKLISYLSNDVPVPLINQSIWFYLPKEPQPIQLDSPANSIQESMIQTKTIFNYLSITNILFIFHLMLLEQKILFIDNNYKILSEISFAFISLLYPFDWVNTYIPVTSLSTVEFLQSFIPFIMGIDEYLLNYSTQKGYISQTESDGIVYVSISKNIISTSLPKKREGKKTLMKDLNIPDFPEKIYKKLYKELKEIKAKMKKGEGCIEKMIKDSFIRATIMLISNYKSFTYYPNDSVPLVNKEQYCAFPSAKDHKVFRAEILASQNYNQFLLNEKELSLAYNSNNNRKRQGLSNDTINLDYFNKMYNVYCKQFEVNRAKDKKSKVSKKKKNPKGNHIHLSTILEETSSEDLSNTDNSPLEEKQFKDTEFKTYLLSPYFIRNPLMSTEKSKIEEWIKSNNQKQLSNESSNSNNNTDINFFIIEDSIAEYSFKTINDNSSNCKYIFPEDIILNKEVNQFTLEEPHSTITIHNNDSSTKTNKSHLTEEEQNAIFECFKSMCITNRTFPIDNKPNLVHLVKTPSGVDYLISLLLPENRYFRKLEQKSIKEENFIDLVFIVRNAMSSLRELDYIQGRQLTLIALSYYKVIMTKEGKAPFYLYEGIIFDKYKFPMWIDDHFWMAFIKEEYNHPYTIDQNDNDTDDDDKTNTEEEIGETYIIAVYSLMHALNLSKTLIKKSLLFPTASKYLNTNTRIILERKINED